MTNFAILSGGCWICCISNIGLTQILFNGMKTVKVFRELSPYARLLPVSFFAQKQNLLAAWLSMDFWMELIHPQKVSESQWQKSTTQLVKNDQFDAYFLAHAKMTKAVDSGSF